VNLTTAQTDRAAGTNPNPASPVDARAQAFNQGANATTTLHADLGPQAIAGSLTGNATLTAGAPVPLLTHFEAHADGSFTLTFNVTEATPYALNGRVAISSRFFDDSNGRAELALTEDGTRLAGAAVGPGGPTGGTANFVNTTGTLIPGRTYALIGSLETPARADMLTLEHFADSVVEFNLTTVPEPTTTAALLIPGALLLLARRRGAGQVG